MGLIMKTSSKIGRRGVRGWNAVSSARRARRVVAVAGEAVGLDRWGRLVGGLAPALVIGLLAGRAAAGPEGAQVAAGNVQISRQGNTTVIRASDRAIINYKSFDIAGNETVQFVQPDSLARVLNRINSAAPTKIDGKLLANGRVFIVNPAGVIFGKGAVINAAGIFAAAGNITDNDFVKGIYRFTDVQGSVLNEGTIQAQNVALVGKFVGNSGSIVADKGAVVMASAESVLIGEQGGHMYVRLEQPAGDGSQTNASRSPANNPYAVGDMYSLAIRSAGTVKAKEAKLEAAKGVVAVEGKIDVSTTVAGAKGGNASVLGEYVGVSGTIDASGPAGGGQILVGGNFQGAGPEANAVRTTITPSAELRADATQAGDGGRVIVWSDDQTNFAGHISATGSGASGAGGFAEVSGKQNLRFKGTAELGGPAVPGQLLLDPAVITLTGGTGDGAADGTSTFFGDPSGGEGFITFADTGPTTVFESEIEDLVANSAASITLQATESINTSGTFTGGLSLGATNFTLQVSNATAAGVIDLSGVSIDSTSGNIQVLGSTSGVQACTITLGAISTGTGTITVSNGLGDITAGGLLSTTGGGINLTTLNGALAVNAAATITGAADIVLNSTGADTTVAAQLTSTAGAITFGNTGTAGVNLGAGVSGNTGITFTHAVNVTTAATVQSDAGLITTLAGFNANANNVVFRADQVEFDGGAASVSGTGTIDIRPTLDSTSISVGDAATGTFDLDVADIDALGSSFSQITIGSATGTGVTTVGSAAFNSPVTIAQGGAGGQIALTGTAALTTSNDALTLTAGTGDAGSITRPDGGTINAGNGLITITADAMDLGSATGEIQTTGGVILQPASATRPIVIGGAGSASDLVLSQAEVDDVISGEAFLGIGRANGQHAIGVGTVAFGSATTVRTPSGGAITVDGAITAPDLRLQGAKVFATGASASATANLFLDGGTSTITGASVALSGGTGTLTSGVIDIGTNQLTLTGDEITINGAITGSGASVLLLEPSANGVSIDVGVNSGGTGTLDLSDAEIANISGVGSLGIGRATGTHTIVIDDITFPVATTVRTPSGGSIAVDGAVAAPGLRLQGVKSFNSGGSLTASTGTLFLDGGTGTLTANTAFTADEIDLVSTITGAFVLTLQPTTNTTSIGIGGGAGTLDVSDSDLASISGTSGIIIGRSGGTHAIAVGSSTFADPATVRGGVITTSAAVTGTGDASVTFNGSSILLGGNISTAGQPVALQGPVTVTAASPTIDTTVGATAGASVTVTGALNAQAAGSQSLSILGGTGGTIDLQQAVGGTALSQLTLNGGTLQVGAVTTTGAIDFKSRNPMALSGLLTVGGSASFQTLKTSGSNISVTNAGNTFGSISAQTRSDDGSGGSVAGDIQIVESGNSNVTLGESGGSFALTSTGNVVFSGPVTVGTNVSSSGVGFTSNSGAFIQATDGSVTINHTGAVVINDTIDASLNASNQTVSISGTTIDVNASVTADDNLTLTGSGLVTVASGLSSIAGAVDVTGSGLAVTSAGSVASASTTAFDGGAGAVAVNGPVTAGTGFSSTGAGFSNSGTGTITATTGDVVLAHTGNAAVGATLESQAAQVTVNAAGVTLSASNSLDAATTVTVNATGDLDVAGDVSGATSILLHAGNDGTGDLGFTAAGVDLSSASITLRAGNGTGSPVDAFVDAITNAPSFRGAAGGATSPTTYVHRQDATILNGQIANASQFQAATNVQGVNYTLQSDDGSINLTDASKVAGANLTMESTGPFVISTNLDFGNSSVTIGGPADVQASGVEVSVGTGTLEFASTLSLNANNLTLTGDEIDFTGGPDSVTGTAGLVLQPSTPSLAIFLGAAETGGRLDLSDTDLAALDTDFSLVTVGRDGGTHAINFDSVTVRDPFLVRGQTIELLSNGGGPALQATGRGSVSLLAGTITLNDDVRTESGPVNFDGNVVLSPDIGNSITVLTTDNSTPGADISFNGLTDSDGTPRDLIAQGGVGGTTFFGQVGGSPLSSLSVTSQAISLANVITSGLQSYTGGATLNGNLTSTAAGAVTITGTVSLGGDVAIQTNGSSASDDITITAAITGNGNDLTTNAGAQGAVLLGGAATGLGTLNATGATVSIQGVTSAGSQTYTGVTTANGNLATTAAGDVTFNNNATVTGNVSTTSGSVSFGNDASLSGNISTTGTGTIGVTGTTTLTGATQTFQTQNRNITLGPVTGASALTLNAGTGAVSVGQVGATRLASLAVTAQSITTSSTVDTTGNQQYTGATTLGGNLSTTGGSTRVTGQTTLAAPVTVATSDGDISFVGISGANNPLVLNAGDGAIVLTGDAGSLSSLTATGETIALRAVTTSGSQIYNGDATLGGALESDTAGSITVNGDTSLAAAVSISTAGASTDDVTLGAVDGNSNALAVSAGSGDVVIGEASDLSAVAVTGGTIGLTSVNSSGDQIYTGATTVSGDLVTTAAGSITVTGATVLSGASQNFTTAGGNVTLGTVDGPANLTINAPGGTIQLGTVGATPLQSFVAQGGAVNLLSTVETTGGQQYSGEISLGGNLTSAGGNIGFTGDTTLTPPALAITTGGGSVSSSGNVTGTSTTLTINAGAGDVDVNAILHDLADNGTPGLNSINVAGRDITVGRVATTGSQTYAASRNLNVQGQLRTAGASNINLTGTSLVNLGNNLRTGGTGAISVTGPTRLNTGGTVTVATGNGDITFANDIDAATDGVGGLVINAGTGAVDLQGNVGTGAAGRLASLNATGATIGVRSVNTAQAQQYSGATALNGNLTSGAVTTVNGPLTLLTDAVVTAAGGATFTGTVDAQTAGQQGLTVAASGQAVNFQDAVGASAALEQLTVTGNTTATGVTTTGGQTYSGPLAASSLTSSSGSIAATGGAFAVTGAVSAAGGSLTADAGGSNVTVGGAVNAQSTSLTGQSISVSTVTTTTGGQTYTGATTATGALVSAAGITGTGAFTAQGNVTATGALSLNGGNASAIDLQGETAAQSASLTGSSVAVSNVQTSNGSQTFTGPTTVRGDLTATGGGITVDGATTLSTAASHTFTANGQAIQLQTVDGGTGALSLNGQTVSLGAASNLGSLSATATGGISLSTVSTTGNQTYTGPTTLDGNLTATAGGVSITGLASLSDAVAISTAGGDITLAGVAGGGNALTLGSSGAVSLSGDAADLASLTATGSSVATRNVTTTGAQSYTGPTTVTGSVQTTSAGGVTFNSAATITGNVSTTGGSIEFNNAVSLGGNLATATTGDISADGPLTLTGSSAQTISSSQGTISLASIDGSTAGQQSLTIVSGKQLQDGDTAARVRLSGNVGATTRLQSFQFGNAAATGGETGSVIPALATVAFATPAAFNAEGQVLSSVVESTPGAFSITADTFTMTQGEKVTAFGNLTINASQATLRDTNAFGKLVLNVPSITLATRSRAPQVPPAPGQKQNDIGMDLVARDGVAFAGGSTVTIDRGSSGDPDTAVATIGSDVISTPPASVQGGSITTLQFVNGVTLNSFRKNNDPAGILSALDLRADGRTSTNVATAIAGATPREADISPGQTIGISASMREQLADVGIYVKDLDPDLQIEYLVGRAIFVDVPETPNPAPNDYKITPNRLAVDRVREVLDSFRGVKTAAGAEEAGSEWKDKAAVMLAESADACAKAKGKDILDLTGQELGEFVMNDPGQAQARQLLVAASQFLDRVASLGLSPGEARAPRDTMIYALAGRDLTTDQVQGMLEAARQSGGQ